MQISVDGFVSTGPNDDQSWVTWAWDEIKADVLALHDTADTQLLGRKLAEGFVPYWLDTVTRPADPMYELAWRTVAFRKVIFSQTMGTTAWPNTEVTTQSPADFIKQLKSESGKDILVVGGSSLVASLVKEGLIDEFYLYVNPVALGRGESIFSHLPQAQQLRLFSSKVFPSGLVLHHYGLK